MGGSGAQTAPGTQARCWCQLRRGSGHKAPSILLLWLARCQSSSSDPASLTTPKLYRDPALFSTEPVRPWQDSRSSEPCATRGREPACAPSHRHTCMTQCLPGRGLSVPPPHCHTACCIAQHAPLHLQLLITSLNFQGNSSPFTRTGSHLPPLTHWVLHFSCTPLRPETLWSQACAWTSPELCQPKQSTLLQNG